MPRGIPKTPRPIIEAMPMPPRHPAWAYRTLILADDGAWYDGDARLTFNELGADGWELVTIYTTGEGGFAPRYHAVFKRSAG